MKQEVIDQINTRLEKILDSKTGMDRTLDIHRSDKADYSMYTGIIADSVREIAVIISREKIDE